jgi:hypothetical protein
MGCYVYHVDESLLVPVSGVYHSVSASLWWVSTFCCVLDDGTFCNFLAACTTKAVLPLLPQHLDEDVCLNPLEDIGDADNLPDTTSFIDYVTELWVEGWYWSYLCLGSLFHRLHHFHHLYLRLVGWVVVW